jgi:hypothetical protein
MIIFNLPEYEIEKDLENLEFFPKGDSNSFFSEKISKKII